MNIQVDKFILTVNEIEMWMLIWSLRDNIKNEIDNSCRFNGYETLEVNKELEINMMEQLCRRIGRVDIYKDEMNLIKRIIDEKMKEEVNNE